MALNQFVVGRYPREGMLRDGAAVRLAPMSESDLEAVCQFLRESPAAYGQLIEPDVTMCGPGQVSEAAIECEEVFPLLAWQGSRVIGEGLLYRVEWPGLSSGRVVIVEHSEFQGKGVARLLLEELMQAALAGGLTQLVAQCVRDQRSVIEALLVEGFVEHQRPQSRVDRTRDRVMRIRNLSRRFSTYWQVGNLPHESARLALA